MKIRRGMSRLERLGGFFAYSKGALVAVVVGASLGVSGTWYFHADPPSSAVRLVSLPVLLKHEKSTAFEIETKAASYYARDVSGGLIPEARDGKNYYKIAEGSYFFSRRLQPEKTVLLVMDPWEDSGSPFLNEYYEPIMRDKLLPLVEKSVALGISVVVLTNPPTDSRGYGASIFPQIDRLVNKGAVQVVYHGSVDADGFSRWLRDSAIDTLIYSGFASNNCVIGRDLGMVSMKAHGFRLFFVPKASAAIEFEGSWKSGELHEATTLLISQWIAELIDLDGFLSLKTAGVPAAVADRSKR